MAREYRVYNRGTTPGRYETAYQTETESYNRLKLKYKISKAMNLANETYQNFDGFYAASRNSSDRGNQDRGHRLSNIVKLGYTF